MSTYKTDLERAIEAAERGSLTIGGMNAEGYATRLPVAAKTSEGRAVRVILEDAKAVIAERDRLLELVREADAVTLMLRQEAWPEADLYLHGSKVPARAIRTSDFRRLQAFGRECEEALEHKS